MSKMFKQLGASGRRVFGWGEYNNEYWNRRPQAYSTPYSSVREGHVTIDPSVRALQDEGLTRSRGLYNQAGQANTAFTDSAGRVRTHYDDLRKDSEAKRGESYRYYGGLKDDLDKIQERFAGNEGGLIQARVNPVLQRGATTRGEIERGQGARGLSGSSFANRELAGFDTDLSREEGDVRSVATQEALQAQQSGIQLGDALGRSKSSIDQAYGNLTGQYIEGLSGKDREIADNTFKTIAMQSELNNDTFEVAQSRLVQELKALGLAQGQIEQYMKVFEDAQKRTRQGVWGLCWVAVELYGEGKKTQTIREFVFAHLNDSSWLGIFCRSYLKYGLTWAELVKRYPLARLIAYKIWDALYRRANG